MDLEKIKHVHFTGIVGVGMTALALIFKEMGLKVTGSDSEEAFVTHDYLKESKITWSKGFGKKNLKPKPDLLITTAAFGGFENPEVIAARKQGIKTLAYAEALAELTKKKELIAICGVGGKTTTSSMVATVLTRSGTNPSYVVGVSKIDPLGQAGKYKKAGKYFIAEADDYVISPGVNDKPKFSLLFPKIAVVTNIEFDHPDVYRSLDHTISVFKEFFEKIPKDGLLVACGDSKNVRRAIDQLTIPVSTYGFRKDNDWQVKDVSFDEGETKFSIWHKGKKIRDLSINVPGRYNVLNAAASYVVADFVGLNAGKIEKGLLAYKGCKRRFEKVGLVKGRFIFDDYAHHPNEIRSVLKAAKDWFPNQRLVAVFQPHTYSRTKSLLDDFSKSFGEADIVGVVDIYASARENDNLGVSSRLLADKIGESHPNAQYVGSLTDAIGWFDSNTRKDDIVLTIGAGDIFHLGNDLLKTHQ